MPGRFDAVLIITPVIRTVVSSGRQAPLLDDACWAAHNQQYAWAVSVRLPGPPISMAVTGNLLAFG